MNESLDILKQTIEFARRYGSPITSIEPHKFRSDFWSQEDMTTSFFYQNEQYIVEQSWCRDGYQNLYFCYIYCGGKETNKDINFVKNIYELFSEEHDACIE